MHRLSGYHQHLYRLLVAVIVVAILSATIVGGVSVEATDIRTLVAYYIDA